MNASHVDGWLAPGGGFHPCSPGTHFIFLEETFGVGAAEASKVGWLRLDAGEWVPPEAGCVSFAQASALKEWHRARGFELPAWVCTP